MRRSIAGIVLITIAALALAGCDKCGHRIKFNAPTLPHACGDNAGPAR